MARDFVVALCALLIISTLGCEIAQEVLVEHSRPSQTLFSGPWVSFPAPETSWYGVTVSFRTDVWRVDLSEMRSPFAGGEKLTFSGLVNETKETRFSTYSPVVLTTPPTLASNINWREERVGMYEATLESPFPGLAYELTLVLQPMQLEIRLINDFGD